MRSIHALAEHLAQAAPHSDPLPAKLADEPDAAGIAARWRALGAPASTMTALACDAEIYGASIENYIGTVRVPLGIAGPLRICGTSVRGDVYVPLATTETALVGSVQRGATAIAESGGCTAVVVDEITTRTRSIELASVRAALAFMMWTVDEIEAFRRVAESTTERDRVRDVRFTLDGRRVQLHVEVTTGDAVGDDAASVAADAVIADTIARSPVRPIARIHEAADKRVPQARGRRVVAEVIVPGEVIERVLGTSSSAMVRAFRFGAAAGCHAPPARTLAAVFIACGQELGGIAEAVGLSELVETTGGELHATLTLSGLVVGTIGGGTGLPAQRACLDMLGAPTARGFAELCAATCLAGELATIAELAIIARSDRPVWRDRLSPRLRRVLDLLLTGLSEKQIADRTRLSVATTHQYVVEIYRVVGVSSRAQLMATIMRPS